MVIQGKAADQNEAARGRGGGRFQAVRRPLQALRLAGARLRAAGPCGGGGPHGGAAAPRLSLPQRLRCFRHVRMLQSDMSQPEMLQSPTCCPLSIVNTFESLSFWPTMQCIIFRLRSLRFRSLEEWKFYDTHRDAGLSWMTP